MTSKTVRTIGRWIRLLILNTASLNGNTKTEDRRIYASPSTSAFNKFEWTLETPGTLTGTRLEEKWKTYPANPDARPVIAAQHARCLHADSFRSLSTDPEDLQDLETIRQSAPLFLVGHPDLHHGPTLQPALARQLLRPPSLRRVADHALEPIRAVLVNGLCALHQRLEGQLARSPDFSTALQSVPRRQLNTKAWGTTQHQDMFWYRLTIGGLNTRDHEGRTMPCPHSSCDQVIPADLEHILWHCPAAHRFWTELFTRWVGPRTLADDDVSQLHRVFSRNAPPIRPEVLTLATAVELDFASVRLCCARLWTVICTAAAQHLWLSRNDSAFHTAKIAPDGLVTRTWKTVHQQLMAIALARPDGLQGETSPTLVRVIWEGLCAEPTEHAVRKQAIWFFDGGSRGNPGRAGSGSVLVERDSPTSDWIMVWWEAHYLGDQATNNEAEHTAVLRGVEECKRRYERDAVPITILGDSTLVLTQIAGHARCANGRLNRVARRTQRALSGLYQIKLRHTLRAGNKMADRLANHGYAPH